MCQDAQLKWNFLVPKLLKFDNIFPNKGTLLNHLSSTRKPAIHLSSNWRECEKMLANREKWEVYRWHFVHRLANHFSHLAFSPRDRYFHETSKRMIWQFSSSFSQKHLSFLVFRQVCALFCELFREIANQSIYNSHNITDLVHLRFCKKLPTLSSLMFRENTDRMPRTAKHEMRKTIGETVYKMSSTHFSFLSFHQHLFAFSSIWR